MPSRRFSGLLGGIKQLVTPAPPPVQAPAPAQDAAPPPDTVFVPFVASAADAATVAVRGSRMDTTPYSGLAISGEVRNALTDPVYGVYLDATFYDAANKPVAFTAGMAYLDQTSGGQVNPFKLILSNAPTGVDHYDLKVTWRTTDNQHYVLLTVVSTTDHAVTTLAGEIRNDTRFTVRYARVVATLYDANGGVVETGYAYPTQTELAPGMSTTYTILRSGSSPASSVVVQAEGWQFDPSA